MALLQVRCLWHGGSWWLDSRNEVVAPQSSSTKVHADATRSQLHQIEYTISSSSSRLRRPIFHESTVVLRKRYVVNFYINFHHHSEVLMQDSRPMILNLHSWPTEKTIIFVGSKESKLKAPALIYTSLNSLACCCSDESSHLYSHTHFLRSWREFVKLNRWIPIWSLSNTLHLPSCS